MNQELQIFKHEEFGNVRVVEENGECYFVAADVCKALELTNPSKAVASLDDDEKGVTNSYTRGGYQNMTTVNESGLYALVLKSRKPNAKKFRKWLTSEVVVSIRKNGMYINPNAPIDPRLLRKMADELEARDKKIAQLQPKADYCDKILQSPEALNVTVIAKDYGMSGVMFNQLLYSFKIQYPSGKTWVLYQEHVGKGYTVTVTEPIKNGGSVTHMKWTQKGREFIYNELKKQGKVPLCERKTPMATLL